MALPTIRSVVEFGDRFLVRTVRGRREVPRVPGEDLDQVLAFIAGGGAVESAAGFAPPLLEVLTRVRTTGFVLPHDTLTPIAFPVVVENLGALFNPATPNRIDVPEGLGGLYLGRLDARFQEDTSTGTPFAGNRGLQLRVGPSRVEAEVRVRAVSSGVTSLPLPDEIELEEGDTLRAGGYQDSGGDMNILARLSLRKLL